jgi:hypothetical protein
MFWSLPQAIRGTVGLPRAVGVLAVGSLLVALGLAALLFVVALPLRSEALVLLAWSLQTAYVLLACVGVWRSARNGLTSVSRTVGRVLPAFVAAAQVLLFVSLFAPQLSRIIVHAFG